MKENENRQNMFMLEIGETAFPSELVINDLEGGGSTRAGSPTRGEWGKQAFEFANLRETEHAHKTEKGWDSSY